MPYHNEYGLFGRAKKGFRGGNWAFYPWFLDFHRSGGGSWAYPSADIPVVSVVWRCLEPRVQRHIFGPKLTTKGLKKCC